MEIIIEFLGELFLEGIIELIKSKEVPAIIRYSLLFIICAFYLALIVLLMWIAINSLHKDVNILAIILIVISLFLLGMLHVFIKKVLKS